MVPVEELAHAVEVAMIDKDYIVLFVFASPDASKLDEMATTIQSLQFTNLSN
jgi:hypothetical protein